MERDDWNRRYEGADLVWTAEPNRFLVEQTAGLRPGKALDLGCGEGRNAVWLAEQGWDVTGVDFSDVALQKAQDLAGSRGVEAEWVEADLREYVPEPGMFDLVAVVYIHVPADERRTMLRRAAGAVAPGGSLVVIGHDRRNLTQGVGGPQDPDVLFSPEDVVADVEGRGLVTRSAEQQTRDVVRDGETLHAIDAVVRLERET